MNQGQILKGNDSQHVFDQLHDPRPFPSLSSEEHVLHTLTAIAGPYAFIYLDASSRKLLFGRDPLGRRSLLSRPLPEGGLSLCSIADQAQGPGWEEVESGGLHIIDLNSPDLMARHLPLPSDYFVLNRELPPSGEKNIDVQQAVVRELQRHLVDSLSLRIKDVPTLGAPLNEKSAKLAILFSGGLDCTVLARQTHEILPTEEAIDLINVAFQNPRAISAASGLKQGASPYESCPDRITGRLSYQELCQTCPGRTWRLVTVDVPYTESESHHDQIVALMAPHNTEMDLSISKALYFAARAQGHVIRPDCEHESPYKSQARVLLSGLGADELFGGYTRHATACARGGYRALQDELELDIRRLGRRNLGRDDRVISHWGKEVRYPYLDEKFMEWALRLPVWRKCAFTPGNSNPDPKRPRDEIDSPSKSLDPAKRILRLLALQLGMPGVAQEKKRAIQFGARTAKMYIGRGRSRGTDVIS